MESAYRSHNHRMKADHSDTSISGVLERHTAAGSFFDAANLAPRDAPAAWEAAKAGAQATGGVILLAASVALDALVFTSAELIEINLRGVLELPQNERAASIDATFNIGRSTKVLATIGTNSVSSKAEFRTKSRFRELAKVKNIDIGPDDGGSGYSIVLSFRPIVLVWCPTENSKSWMLGFTTIIMAANGIRHTLTRPLEGPVFALCCADGAQAGYKGFRGVFPLGRWLQCWVHVTRNPQKKMVLLREGTPAGEIQIQYQHMMAAKYNNLNSPVLI